MPRQDARSLHNMGKDGGTWPKRYTTRQKPISANREGFGCGLQLLD